MGLKICIVGTAYPYKGGIAMFNERLARQLHLQGHEVEIVTFTLQYPKIFFPGTSQFSDDPPPEDLKITRMVNSIHPWSWWQTARYLREQKFDLIIAKFWIPAMGPSLGTILRRGRSAHTQIISIIDNIIPHEKRLGDQTLSKYFVNGVDGFIVMSKQVQSQMDQFISDQPVAYVPHPIYDTYGDIIDRNVALQHLGLDTKYDYILFFGYIRDYKGLDILMKSVAIARRHNPKLRLLVAGEYYSDSKKYLQLVEALGIQDITIMRTSFISNEEVKYYFCACDLVAQTYRSATQSGISQMAIYFEKAILSTNVGGLPETVHHNKTGYLTTVNPEAIAEHITTFFTDQPADRFSPEIKKLKELYSWNYFGDKLVELYEKLRS